MQRAQNVSAVEKALSELKISKSTFVKHNTELFTANYKVGPELGSGSFGSVRRCTHAKTGFVRAVKLINKNPAIGETDESIKKELEILRALDHPNIVKLFEYYEDTKRYYIVME